MIFHCAKIGVKGKKEYCGKNKNWIWHGAHAAWFTFDYTTEKLIVY